MIAKVIIYQQNLLEYFCITKKHISLNVKKHNLSNYSNF